MAVISRGPGDLFRKDLLAPRVGELLQLKVEVLGATADARVSDDAHVLVLTVSMGSRVSAA